MATMRAAGGVAPRAAAAAARPRQRPAGAARPAARREGAPAAAPAAAGISIGASTRAAAAPLAARRERRLGVVAQAARGDFGASRAPPPPPPAKVQKPRLPGLDSVRFFLIAYISIGHFIMCATKDMFVLKLFTQVNVVVGAFFVLSGYVAGYVATELRKYEASPRISPEPAYTIGRIAGYYPLYLFVQVLFGAMFVFADVTYNGPLSTAFHALITMTMTQAWFPLHAELWNAPTWFLSALTFAMLVLPYALPPLAKMRKGALRKTMLALAGISLVAKLGYSYDLNAWTMMEGVTPPKLMPNLMYFNAMRFNPFFALVEVLMGVVAARMVMTESQEETDASAQSGVPPAVLAVAMVAGMWARAAGLVAVNDMLFRGLFFIPLFTWFCIRVHKVTVATGGAPASSLTKLLAAKPLVYLGSISFAIFMIHGPLGQLFYKKVVATKVWGVVFTKYPWFFPYWCIMVLLAAAALQKFFIENKAVQQATKDATKAVQGWFA